MKAIAPVYDYLKLDRAVSSQLRVRGWEKEPTAVASGAAAHHAVELTLIEAGTVRYEIGGREHLVIAGDVMVVPHEADHRTTFLTDMRGIALWIGEDLIREVTDAMGPDVQRGVLTAGVLSRGADAGKGNVSNARIRSLLRVLADEVTEGEAGHTRAAEALADSVVIEMLRRAPRAAKVLGGRGARDPRVLRAIAQMNASFADALSVDDLAKTANMSRFHFSRLFRDEAGEAPYQYLLKVRVARATELLRSGHVSVTEAAISAGFSDFSRFSRTFKKHTGKLPTEVLREARTA